MILVSILIEMIGQRAYYQLEQGSPSWGPNLWLV